MKMLILVMKTVTSFSDCSASRGSISGPFKPCKVSPTMFTCAINVVVNIIDSTIVKFVQILKILKILKIIKNLKILKILKIVKILKILKMVKMVIIMVMASLPAT